MMRCVRINTESVWMESAVVLEITSAAEPNAEVRNEAFTKMAGLGT